MANFEELKKERERKANMRFHNTITKIDALSGQLVRREITKDEWWEATSTPEMTKVALHVFLLRSLLDRQKKF